MNSLIQVFQLVGSLGLFIYGMVLMSESIQRLAGKRLRSAVSTVTRNPARAYVSGLSLTGLLQSSSVTSLMAVSFVQVGLLRLSEAYFVLLGANLGTTVTGWLVALTISKPSIGSFALPILACALPLLFAQRRRTRSAGEAVIGFALMFVGLGLLKDGVPPITEAGLAQFLAQFSGGGIGGALGIVAIGIVGTVALQSSSAMMALIITLAAGGVVSEWGGAAMLLGANIGTTSTVILASLVAGREARRAALSHFLINLFGVLLALPILHILLDGIAWFLAPMDDGAVDIAIHLALLHTGFNGVVTGLFGLFPRPILWLVRKLVPGEGIRGFKSPLVTASVMDAPELQVLEAQREAERHHELASGMVVEMKALLEELNPTRRKAIADRLMEAHNLGARYEGEIKGFLERLARSKLSGATYRQVQFLLEWTTEMGQVVELAQRFRQLQSERERDEIFFVPKQRKRLNEMMDLLKEAMGTLGELNTPIAPPYGEAEVHMGQVESTLIELDGVRQQMRKSRKEDIRKGRYTPESAMAYKEMGDLLEEMGLRMGLVVSRYAEIFKA